VAAQVLAARVEDLDRLLPLERKALLGALTGQPQPELARVLRLSQPSVSYRVHKALYRLNLLASYPDLGPSDVRRALRVSGYLPRGTDIEEFVSGVTEFLKTTSQSSAAQQMGHSQGWFRHHAKKLQAALQERPSEEGAAVLQALLMIEEHHHILAIESRHVVTKMTGPSGRELLDAAELCSTLVPPPARAQKGTRPKISDAHLEVVVGLLRENGPQLRSAVLEVLTEEGIDAARTIWWAVSKRKVFGRPSRGLAKRPPRVLHLIKPAATSLKESFHLDWHRAIREYCKTYDSFLTDDVMGHIGIAAGYRRHRRDNARIVGDLLKAEGFAEEPLGRWSRKSTPHRVSPSPESREEICAQILEAIASGGVVPRREIDAHVTASPSQVTGALRQLLMENKIVKMGQGPSTVYLSTRSA
jgi:hypothetical protein